ncbi:hypothetical protein LENED_003811 [Lentinula edodes]|uniref:Uncharacterized protein n=1 Tax=Lentinula edodes TaxID=5353 RepID=A0A1Q3E4K7_LENED|nr:hypothetical protein LENED_003811 [Lentinula edodes]
MTHMDRQASTSPIVSVPSFDSLLPPVDIIPLRVPLSPLFLYTQLRAMNSHSQYRLDDHRDGLNDAGYKPENGKGPLPLVPIHTLIISFAKNSLVNFLWGFFNKFFYIDVFSTALSWHG